MVAPKTNDYELIVAKPFSPNLGAEIFGVDLSQDVPDGQFAEIRDAFHKYQVLFFKDQKEIPPEQHVKFGKRYWTAACTPSSSHHGRPSRDF